MYFPAKNCAFSIIFGIIATVAATVLVVFAYSTNSGLHDTTTLELVHIIFRHGDRTIDNKLKYPTDPYINETYYPYGLGELTNVGKRRSYLLGKELRLRYDNFLGSIYIPQVLQAVSSEYTRAKMSLQLVLAGLYPPKGTVLEWATDLNWQPIPYDHIDPFSGNHLLSFPLGYCPKFIKLYNEYLNSTEALLLKQKHEKLYKYLSKHVGVDIRAPFDLLVLYTGLTTEKDWGHKLPSWTDPVYPESLEKVTGDFYISSSSSLELKQLTGGFLLDKIIADTQAKVENRLPAASKMFLYSGHDINIAYIMRAMDMYYPHEPSYSAYISVEVHKINGAHGIKVYYQNYEKSDPILMRVSGCDDFCPFDQFVELLKMYLPQGDNPCEDGIGNATGAFDINKTFW